MTTSELKKKYKFHEEDLYIAKTKNTTDLNDSLVITTSNINTFIFADIFWYHIGIGIGIGSENIN